MKIRSVGFWCAITYVLAVLTLAVAPGMLWTVFLYFALMPGIIVGQKISPIVPDWLLVSALAAINAALIWLLVDGGIHLVTRLAKRKNA